MQAKPRQTNKRPFNIKTVLSRIRKAVKPFPKAAMFQLAAEGFNSVFEQLAACIISIRTRDEVTIPTAQKLFVIARTPRQVARLTVTKIDELIHSCSFHRAKAEQIRDIARQALNHYGGKLPCDRQVLESFRGVGSKCASLVLGIACEEPHIGVDVHVHRIVNRWGYVRSSDPEKTMYELHNLLPKHYWIELNSLLVPFGKHVCTGRLPKCSTCPVLEMCQQVGVTEHR